MTTESGIENREFELRGINHLALLCSDMNKTIAFYGGVLGMPLVEDIELPDRQGHHFIFDVGKGTLLAFFWFNNEPKGASMAGTRQRHIRDKAKRPHLSVVDSRMCHLAFDVPAEKIDDYLERLQAKGVPATIVNYEHSAHEYSDPITENTIGRSIYFTDPDGVVLEFATSSPVVATRVQIERRGSEAQISLPIRLAAGTGL